MGYLTAGPPQSQRTYIYGIASVVVEGGASLLRIQGGKSSDIWVEHLRNDWVTMLGLHDLCDGPHERISVLY